MATTINSGYANSPKLTANIADHADVFGGRALVFDGVSDYLTISQDVLASKSQGTISFWTKTSGTGNQAILGYHRNQWSIRLNKTTMFLGIGGTTVDASTTLDNSAWGFHTITFNSGTAKFYKDGELYHTATSYGSSFPSNSNGIFIGKRNHASAYYYNGSIADVKLFDTALTEAQVQKLYKKPENTPSAVQDNLVAWYPMIESNPESPQSIVYDHSEKKLSSNYVTNSTFDSDITGWSLDGTRSNTSISHSTIDSKTCVDISDQSTSDRIYARFDLGDNAIDGELYKISYYVRKSQTGSTSKDFIIGLGFSNVGGDAGNVDKTVAEYDTWEFQEAYIICGSSNNYIQFLPTAYDNSHIGRLFLDDVKVQKVLMGNHATTNFFGDELVNNGDLETWTSNTAPAIWQIGDAASKQSGARTGGSGSFYADFTPSSNGYSQYKTGVFSLTNGKSYKLQFYYKNLFVYLICLYQNH
jgi:hypothetical protein